MLAVNKMDLVDYSQEAFDAIVARLPQLRRGASGSPTSPRSRCRRVDGDNIIERSANMPWYQGPTLLEHLESVQVDDAVAGQPFRLPVQWVNRPNQDFRGFAGRSPAAAVSTGDRIRVLPSGRESTVARIVTADGDLDAGRRRPVGDARRWPTRSTSAAATCIAAGDAPPQVAEPVRGHARVDAR